MDRTYRQSALFEVTVRRIGASLSRVLHALIQHGDVGEMTILLGTIETIPDNESVFDGESHMLRTI